MYTLKLPSLYPEYQLAVSLISGQHATCFHKSRILANAVPLGFCCGGFSSTAGYDPATKLNLRRATFAPLRRVLPKGCHSFLFEWLEKVSQPSLAEPFGSDAGVTRIDSRLSILSFGCHHPIAVPLSVSNAA